MAVLAIKGHPTRGRDIIQLLEMLGGRNSNNCTGQYINRIYFMNKYGYIESTDDIKLQLYCATYNLEEFLEKFPYNVGDKVLYKIYGIYSKIKSMLWNVEKEQVFYRLCSNKLFVATADELKPLKEETIEESIDKTNKVIFETNVQSCDISNEIIKKDVEEIKIDIPNGYEFYGIDDDNKIVLTKIQSQYPKTHEECFNICLGNKHHIVQVVGLDDLGDNKELFKSFIKLKICRNAYWKIAGDWKPNWKDFSTQKYSISVDKDDIILSQRVTGSRIFVFPTEEMRDTFYNNFKDLIEQCKELL